MWWGIACRHIKRTAMLIIYEDQFIPHSVNYMKHNEMNTKGTFHYQHEKEYMFSIITLSKSFKWKLYISFISPITKWKLPWCMQFLATGKITAHNIPHHTLSATPPIIIKQYLWLTICNNLTSENILIASETNADTFYSITILWIFFRNPHLFSATGKD